MYYRKKKRDDNTVDRNKPEEGGCFLRLLPDKSGLTDLSHLYISQCSAK
jgi:hypothetical protein